MNPFANSEDDVICSGASPITRQQLLRSAASLAARLPDRDRVVNLCESRCGFLIAFVASMLRKQPQLLPGTRTADALSDLARRFPSSHVLDDAAVRAMTDVAAGDADRMLAGFDFDPDGLVLTGFTSGSTSISQPHEKRLRALLASAANNGKAIRSAVNLDARAPLSVLGTVPVHHMYGVELTVLLPLFGGMSVHNDRPIFPADVAAALGRMPFPRILVSTPLHLRALSESNLQLPQIALIVSASAPLEDSLAARIEARLGAPLLEMFGSTETCVLATRRTATESEWRLYDGVSISPADGGTRVAASWFAQDQLLHDLVEFRGDGRFILRGRSSDLIEVAGKRASLSDIKRRICAIPGVTDAAVYQPDAAAGTVNRVAALVVGRGVTEKQIIAVLSAGLDPLFLPRPLVFVDAIPRDALGKIPRAGLRQALESR